MWDFDRLMDLISLRIGFWCKAKWPDSFSSIEDFVRFPSQAVDSGNWVRLNHSALEVCMWGKGGETWEGWWRNGTAI
ncbi:hypothetical protein V6N11_017766 [Hibiscus sabdariffa]|uniref:Uncharacterized protein n=1 Tax=Hibiscus sabdariffa TaxID=183260 RepID=A0ABR2TYX9_9ROSI